MPRALAVFLFAISVLYAQPQNATLERYVQEGERALAAGRYEQAEQAFEKVRQLAPPTAEVFAQLGVIYFQQGKFLQAVPMLTQALKLKPGLPNADTLLAMSLSELGRFPEALPGLEKAFRRSTDPAMKRMSGLQLTRAYTGLRRDDRAVETALELRRLYPNDPEVLYHAGRLFGNFAYLTMQKLADVAPESVWRHQASAELYESQEAYDAAIAEYEKVLAMAPRRPGIHFRLGRTMLARARQSKTRTEEIGQAVKEFESELQLDPTNANAAYELGEIHRKSAQFTKACDYFEVGLKYYPEFEDAHIGLGRALLALDKPAPALPHLQKAVALNPESDVAFYALAQAYRALGNTKDQQTALAEFRRLREKHSTQEPQDPKREVTKQEIDPGSR
jgi:tetratricopeptide (TPR) repeat protein